MGVIIPESLGNAKYLEPDVLNFQTVQVGFLTLEAPILVKDMMVQIEQLSSEGLLEPKQLHFEIGHILQQQICWRECQLHCLNNYLTPVQVIADDL